MESRGQAYSTFKLLIAAIVALAILMILLPILSSVLQLFQDQPDAKAIELVNNVWDKPDSMQKTARPVTFSKGTALSAVTISAGTSASQGNICISKGELEGIKDFELIDKPYHKITWNGSSPRTVHLAVYCNIDLDALEEGVKTTTGFKDWEVNCDICKGEGRCCVIALMNP